MTTSDPMPPPEPVNNTPTPAVGEQLEMPGSRQLRELDEMRTIAKRLEKLDPKARKRVLEWLTAQFVDS
jgi:hypothetical protein